MVSFPRFLLKLFLFNKDIAKRTRSKHVKLNIIFNITQTVKFSSSYIFWRVLKRELKFTPNNIIWAIAKLDICEFSST